MSVVHIHFIYAIFAYECWTENSSDPKLIPVSFSRFERLNNNWATQMAEKLANEESEFVLKYLNDFFGDLLVQTCLLKNVI